MSYRRRRHSADGAETSEKLIQKVKVQGEALLRKVTKLKAQVDALWRTGDVSLDDPLKANLLNIEMKRLQEGATQLQVGE